MRRCLRWSLAADIAPSKALSFRTGLRCEPAERKSHRRGGKARADASDPGGENHRLACFDVAARSAAPSISSPYGAANHQRGEEDAVRNSGSPCAGPEAGTGRLGNSVNGRIFAPMEIFSEPRGYRPAGVHPSRGCIPENDQRNAWDKQEQVDRVRVMDVRGTDDEKSLD